MIKHIGLTVALKRVRIWALLMGIYACLAMVKDFQTSVSVPNIPTVIDAAAMFAMGMLLVFRMNRAYDRWWEARKQWGTLVNVSRNLAVKTRELVQLTPEESKNVNNLIVAFCHSLKAHLRDDIELNTLRDYLDDDSQPKHVPSYVVGKFYKLLRDWKDAGRLNDQTLWLIDQELRVFLDVCGACERIKSTLMSESWRVFARQTIAIYLLVLPWGLYDDFGIWTIPLTVIISYFVIAAEGIAQYTEEPFGCNEDHLDLPAICAAITNSVGEILGQESKG